MSCKIRWLAFLNTVRTERFNDILAFGPISPRLPLAPDGSRNEGGEMTAGTSSPLRMAAKWLLLSLRSCAIELDRNPRPSR